MIYDENDLCFLCVCVLNLLQDIHQFALRQIDVYLSQARAQKNTHDYLLITPYSDGKKYLASRRHEGQLAVPRARAD